MILYFITYVDCRIGMFILPHSLFSLSHIEPLYSLPSPQGSSMFPFPSGVGSGLVVVVSGVVTTGSVTGVVTVSGVVSVSANTFKFKFWLSVYTMAMALSFELVRWHLAYEPHVKGQGHLSTSTSNPFLWAADFSKTQKQLGSRQVALSCNYP